MSAAAGRVFRIGDRFDVRKQTHRAYANTPWQACTMHTTVRSAPVGGAAASPIDPEVNVAPLRDVAHIAAAELRAGYAPADPWDPWAPVRIGYDAPAPASLLFPPLTTLDRLTMYLNASVR